jgi:AraC family transcriptional regulator, positive regulator of tynA and feaB
MATEAETTRLHLRQMSSRAKRDEDRLSYWTDVATWGLAVGMPPFRFGLGASTEPFYSHLRWCPGERGAHFLESLNNVPISQSASHNVLGDAIVIGALREGRLVIEHNRGTVTTLGPGELFLSDYGREMRMHWDPHNFLFIVLPRKTVEAAIGHRGLAGQTVQKLSDEGLAPFLWAQLCMLSKHGSNLNDDEWAFALAATEQMAIAVTRHRLSRGSSSPGSGGREALLAAAKLYIEAHCDIADLTAGQIADALHCSRSQLYRVFAEHELEVSGYLRDVRLRRAASLLGTAPRGANIGTVALSCGYTDLSAFGKAFRARFGVSPTEWRALQLLGDAFDVAIERHPRVIP